MINCCVVKSWKGKQIWVVILYKCYSNSLNPHPVVHFFQWFFFSFWSCIRPALFCTLIYYCITKFKALCYVCLFQHEAEYRLFMEAVKGSSGEKRLASQFMARFFKHFPGLARDTINALFDLCEDGDVMVSTNIFSSVAYFSSSYCVGLISKWVIMYGTILFISMTCGSAEQKCCFCQNWQVSVWFE